MVALTQGARGSQLHIGGEVVTVPAITPRRVVDPTGAGDAYIAGLLAGLRRGLDPAQAGRMGSLAATYAVEQQGPQAHRFTPAEFVARYGEVFGAEPVVAASTSTARRSPA
jgi:adenosine kinase